MPDQTADTVLSADENGFTATFSPARPGDTPGELVPEHGPAQPIDLDQAVSLLAQIGDAISPTGERPEEALGTLVADVEAVVQQRDQAVDDVTRLKTHLVNEQARLRGHLTRAHNERDQAIQQAAVIARPADRAQGPAPTVQLAVEYADHQTRYHPAERGWRIDAASRCIVIGRDLPRTYIPLDRVTGLTVERIARED